MCVLVTCIRVSLGVVQWLAVPNGLRNGSYDGNLNSIKLFTSFLAMGAYTGIGLHSSIYEPLQMKRAAVKRETVRRLSINPSSVAEAQKKAPAVQQPKGTARAAAKVGNTRKLLHIRLVCYLLVAKLNVGLSTLLDKESELYFLLRYLIGLFAMLLFYVSYLGWAIALRAGEVNRALLQ